MNLDHQKTRPTGEGTNEITDGIRVQASADHENVRYMVPPILDIRTARLKEVLELAIVQRRVCRVDRDEIDPVRHFYSLPEERGSRLEPDNVLFGTLSSMYPSIVFAAASRVV